MIIITLHQYVREIVNSVIVLQFVTQRRVHGFACNVELLTVEGMCGTDADTSIHVYDFFY